MLYPRSCSFTSLSAPCLCVSTCSLTFLWYDPQGDAEARVLDQLNNVCVWHADNGLAVHRQYPVSHLQLPTAVCRAALDDTPNFVGHSWWRIQTQTPQVKHKHAHAAADRQIGGLRRSVLRLYRLTGCSLSLSHFAVHPRLT